MNTKPIIFSAEMIRALLEDRKTMTRRILKLRSIEGKMVAISPNEEVLQFDDGSFHYLSAAALSGPYLSPYGRPGDLLWVKEKWRIGAWDEDTGRVAVDYNADNYCRREWIEVRDDKAFNMLWLQSSEDCERAGASFDNDYIYRWKPGEAPTRWRSPIYMRKEFSRLTLHITNVRVERVQEINEKDAKAEGVERGDMKIEDQLLPGAGSYRAGFANLWQSINGKCGFGWTENPWCWVIEFEMMKQNVDDVIAGVSNYAGMAV